MQLEPVPDATGVLLARARFEAVWQIARASDEGERQADEMIPAEPVAAPLSGTAREREGETWPQCKDYTTPWTSPPVCLPSRRRGFRLRVDRMGAHLMQTLGAAAGEPASVIVEKIDIIARAEIYGR